MANKIHTLFNSAIKLLKKNVANQGLFKSITRQIIESDAQQSQNVQTNKKSLDVNFYVSIL